MRRGYSSSKPAEELRQPVDNVRRRLIIHRDRERECWSVFRLADEDGSRAVATFDTLHEAEQFVLGQGYEDEL